MIARAVRRAAAPRGGGAMEIDTIRIDEAVLALLYLGLHDVCRAWKGFDWAAMDRLHEKGLISDPVGKAKSVVFTEEGLREAERLLRELFAARRSAPTGSRSGPHGSAWSGHDDGRGFRPPSRPHFSGIGQLRSRSRRGPWALSGAIRPSPPS